MERLLLSLLALKKQNLHPFYNPDSIIHNHKRLHTKTIIVTIRSHIPLTIHLGWMPPPPPFILRVLMWEDGYSQLPLVASMDPADLDAGQLDAELALPSVFAKMSYQLYNYGEG